MGLEISFCVEIKKDGVTTTIDNLNVSQNPHLCYNKLESKNVTSIIKDYGDLTAFASGKVDFFSNSGNEYCGINYCELKTQECKAPYTSQELLMELEAPYNIQLTYSVLEGQNPIHACISCSNILETKTMDFTVYQEPHLCYNKLESKNLTSIIKDYGDPTALASGKDFFKNTGIESCGIISCQIKPIGC